MLEKVVIEKIRSQIRLGTDAMRTDCPLVFAEQSYEGPVITDDASALHSNHSSRFPCAISEQIKVCVQNNPVELAENTTSENDHHQR